MLGRIGLCDLAMKVQLACRPRFESRARNAAAAALLVAVHAFSRTSWETLFAGVPSASSLQPSVARACLQDASPEVCRRHAIFLAAAVPASIANPGLTQAAETVKWREDLPLALAALKDLQKEWATLFVSGLERAGGERVRKTLMTSYDHRVDIVVAAGKEVGIKERDCQVTEVSSPAESAGWMIKDTIIQVDGVSTGKERAVCILRKLVAAANDKNKDIRFTVDRSEPTPFIDMDRKLKVAYQEIDDGSGTLPELEDVQVRIGNFKAIAQTAASAPSVTEATVKQLREGLDALVKQFSTIVSAAA